jgi:proteasome lid subunit RPN8/RPN11
MLQPATVTVTLQAPDAIPTTSGETKQLQECTLADLRAFAQTLEQQILAEYGQVTLAELVAAEAEQIKITILDEAGEPLAMTREQVLSHGLDLTSEPPAPQTEVGPDELAPRVTELESQEPAQDRGLSSDAKENERPADETTAVEEPVATAPAAAGLAPDQSEVAPAGAAPEAPDETMTDVSTDEAPLAAQPAGAADSIEEQESVTRQEAGAEEAAALEEAAAEPSAEMEAATPSGVAVPDVEPAELRILGLRRPPGHTTPAAADILINEPAFRAAQAHARSDLSREVAGMLVGPRPEKQPDGRYVVHVTDVIVARHTRMQGASVTYTPESWRYVTDVLHERYPDEAALIVGWYHTHPGFGIFLSGMDLFIHQHFFTQKWHVALVLDPLAQRSGFFCWDRQQKEVQKYPFPWPEWASSTW